jgi:molybdopterin molybdotransferase
MPDLNPIRDTEVADVEQLFNERIVALDAEPTPLMEALGRTLREAVRADADQPAFDRSAMDGYAFFPAHGPANYHLIGTVKAGETAERVPGAEEALRIFTGAALPAPDMSVLMQEEARVEGYLLIVHRHVERGENVRARGSDARAGTVLLHPGTCLGAAEVALAASVGVTRPLTTRPPRVAHATTGDELVAPEAIPAPGQIRNSNQVLVAALLQNAGVLASHLHHEHWSDDPARAAKRLASANFNEADVILISGGSSVGEHDYAAPLLEAAGFSLHVRKVNSRPGRPLLFGTRGRQVAFGLPGNPISHFVCFNLFVRQALALLSGRKPASWRQALLAEPIPDTLNRRPTYWPARLDFEAPGELRVRPLPWNNSGHLGALAGVQALFRVPASTRELPVDALVDTLLVGPDFAP